MRLTTALAVLTAAALAAGCADTLAPGAVPLGSATAAPADADVSASPQPKETFDPFKRAGETATPGREIIEKPTLAEVLKAGPLPEIAIGRADAPVTIVKYMSLTCPYCRRFQLETYPQLKRELIDTGKVRFILREFPLDNLAAAGAMLARCAGGDKTYPLIEVLFAKQDSWVVRSNPVPKLFEIAKQAGFTQESFDKCLTDQKLLDGITGTRDRANKSLGVRSTPTFFINGKKLAEAPTVEAFDKVLEPLLKAS